MTNDLERARKRARFGLLYGMNYAELEVRVLAQQGREHVMSKQTIHTSLIGRKLRFREHFGSGRTSRFPDHTVVCTIVNVYMREGEPCVDIEDNAGRLHYVYCANIGELCDLIPRTTIEGTVTGRMLPGEPA